MRIIALHHEGGILFMSILSVLLLTNITLALYKAYQLFFAIPESGKSKWRGIPEILQIGTFALFFGILGQVIGLYMAFKAMEGMESVALALLAGGLRVSTITTLWGGTIFAISGICWFVLNQRYKTLTDQTSK